MTVTRVNTPFFVVFVFLYNSGFFDRPVLFFFFFVLGGLFSGEKKVSKLLETNQ